MEERQKRALTRARSKLLKDLDVADVLDHLLSKEIIHHDDYDVIKAKETRKERVAALLTLLPQRGPQAFEELVEGLRPNNSWLADELESQLNELNDSSSTSAADELNNVMRAGAVPTLPAFHVPRQVYTEAVRAELRELKEGRFLAVHGMAGIGKSVCVNHALRDAELVFSHFPGGVFWVSVGQADTDVLINKVQALCERLSDDQATALLPPTIEIAVEKLRKLLNQPALRNCLLVLDDVWKPDVLAVFDLGASVLVTTRDAALVERFEGRAAMVQMKDGFSLAESQELFAKRLGIPKQDLPREATDIHRRCGGVPMVIALLCSYLAGKRRHRESRDRWQKCLDNLRSANYEKLRMQSSAHENVTDAIELSVNSLDDEHAEYFRRLAVFGADINIPRQVLCTYWKMTADDVDDCMLYLVKKSLVQEMEDSKLDTVSYSMHDLVIDYMTKKYTPDEKRELHALLLDRYLEACGGDYGRLPDDEYILWFIGHHVHGAGRYELFPSLYFSLAFVGNKLRATGPSDLLNDYRKYAAFLDQGGKDSRRRDFENFVRTAGHRLPALPLPPSAVRDPSAAVVQLALCERDVSAVYEAASRVARTAGDQLFFRWCNKEAMRWSHVLLTKVFSGPVCDVVFTLAQDNLALTAYGDGHIKLWNVVTGDEHPSFYGHTERVQQLTVSPDGSRFVSASDDQTLKIWDLEAAVRAAYGTDEHDVSSGQRSPSPRVRPSSGAFLFPEAAPRDDSLLTLRGHRAAVLCVDWSPDGAHLLSGDVEGTFKLWDVLGGPLFEKEKAHNGHITCCTFSPDSTYFATGAADGRVRLWSTRDASLLYTFSQHHLRVISLSLSKDNNSIVSVADNEIFCWVWDTSRRPSRDYVEVKMQAPNEHDLYLCSRLSRDQRQLVVGTSSNMYETWDLLERRVISTQRGFAGSVTSLVFSHDGERLLAGAGDMVTSCSLTRTPKVEDSLQPLFSARFASPDPSSLVVAAITSNNGVQVLRGLDGTIVTTTKPVGEKICITEINQAGTMVAFGCEDGSVGVYEIAVASASRAEPNILGKHSQRVISLQFGPDGAVVSGSEDRNMKVWWPDRTNVTCSGNDGAVTQVGLYDSSEGLLAVSCSRDGTLKVYLAASGKLLSAHVAHSGSTVTCYRIVRLAAAARANGTSGRGESPCPPDLVVVTAAVDGKVKMTRLSTGAVVKSFTLDQGPVRTFQLSGDGSLLVTGHDDGDVVVTRTDILCPPLVLKLHQSWVHDLAVSPDGRTIVSVGDCLAWWRLSNKQCTPEHGRLSAQAPGSPRLRPPEKQYFSYWSGRPVEPPAGGGVTAELRQVFAFRGTLARRLAVDDDWTTLVTIDDAGVLYVLQVM
ncbi:apoptotic protease-activating factor 1-like isoform X3 [Pollicipes pollicipes]|uniref:apoptotic protease-activating factor 1-like isoform X3 n=1 Tax=Pollicipes pollicipes TaxID=41117 RepID=UPI0018851044|nr:apoptotic protease-activating factor 1-like isoform X3 [Pollicipes pollicipes]